MAGFELKALTPKSQALTTDPSSPYIMQVCAMGVDQAFDRQCSLCSLEEGLCVENGAGECQGGGLHPSSFHTCLDNRAARDVHTRLADIPSNIKMQGPKKVVSEAPRF